jgi:N-acetylmuramic acid 6-phosphate etherase
MIDMKLSNNKLHERAIRIVESILNVDKNIAKDLIYKYKNIRLAIENYESNDN